MVDLRESSKGNSKMTFATRANEKLINLGGLPVEVLFKIIWRSQLIIGCIFLLLSYEFVHKTISRKKSALIKLHVKVN